MECVVSTITRPAQFLLTTSQVNLHAGNPPRRAFLPCQAGSPAAFEFTGSTPSRDGHESACNVLLRCMTAHGSCYPAGVGVHAKGWLLSHLFAA